MIVYSSRILLSLEKKSKYCVLTGSRLRVYYSRLVYYRRDIMPPKQKIRNQSGVLIGDVVICKQKILHDSNNARVSSDTPYPKNIIVLIFVILIGIGFILIDRTYLGIGFIILGIIYHFFTQKKVADDIERIKGPISSPNLPRPKNIPRGTIPESGVYGWYWK